VNWLYGKRKLPLPPVNRNNRLLLVLQYSPHDERQMRELVDIICHLQEGMSEHASFMLAGRYDVRHDESVLAKLRTRFPFVHPFIASHKGEGHPLGCNVLWWASMFHVYQQVRDKNWHFDAALYFEADCVPLRKDWIAAIHKEWYDQGGPLIMGHKHDKPAHHVNGNCVIHTRLPESVPQVKRPFYQGAWDLVLASRAIHASRGTPTIFNDYQRRNIGEAELFRDSRMAMYHGVKDESARIAVRERFGMPQPTLP
jgi:hypothetical protein